MSAQLAEFLYNLFQGLLEWEHFDRVTGAASFLNVVALIPQLKKVITGPSVEGVSIPSYVIFMVIQATFTLVAIKSYNVGMTISMIVSFILTFAIVIVVAYRGRKTKP